MARTQNTAETKQRAAEETLRKEEARSEEAARSARLTGARKQSER
ncbi:hypothetical protein PR003_g7510 [Phytophthora rubi]|uniref:Uncharacterized protein n=1 Tax=Phytophthora rubi TaxID=129364 RepID=A0A6A4FM89_9STRA|nr:hypothetical protein PR003_g7510 [Phytophthora rubi]